MKCSRGKATPNKHAQLRLFAASGGYCQNPECLTPLFLDVGVNNLHIAEMAHIFAAMDKGPRANASLSEQERGLYENIILLCPTCHTIVDKAPELFPDTLIQDWKRTHTERIGAAFGAVRYPTRAAVRAALKPLLRENQVIFEDYGPHREYRFNPESESADVWRRKMLSHILPNNRRMLAIMDANMIHLNAEEERTVEEFRQHVDDLETRHLGEGIPTTGRTFPASATRLFEEDEAIA